MPNNREKHPHEPDRNPETLKKENLFYDGVICVLRIALVCMFIWTMVNVVMLANYRRALRPDFSIGRITSAPVSFGETHGLIGFLAGFMIPEENAG
ncbi:MAG: hypothetical protein IJE08_01395 [Clostridia bacterium]|nr:hypothetical protein [Clostridia bacterium]